MAPVLGGIEDPLKETGRLPVFMSGSRPCSPPNPGKHDEPGIMLAGGIMPKFDASVGPLKRGADPSSGAWSKDVKSKCLA